MQPGRRGSPRLRQPTLSSGEALTEGERRLLTDPGRSPAGHPLLLTSLPPAADHSPDSTSELVANLRAAGTRGDIGGGGGSSEKRGQHGARTGPTRRSARHAIFAGGGRAEGGAPAWRGRCQGRPLAAAVRARGVARSPQRAAEACEGG